MNNNYDRDVPGRSHTPGETYEEMRAKGWETDRRWLLDQRGGATSNETTITPEWREHPRWCYRSY